MKAFLCRGPLVLLYAAAGAAFLWAGAAIGFYAIPGVCFLALAAWESWTIFRDRQADRIGWPGWSPTISLGYVILALCQIYRSVIEPADLNIALAAGWSVIGVVWAARFVREFQTAGEKKEER